MDRRPLLGLDVGQKRVGVSWTAADPQVAAPLVTLAADESIVERIAELAAEKGVATVVVGLPRNQAGEETGQTKTVREFAAHLEKVGLAVVFQDESLTSVVAEESLKEYGKPYQKEDVDKLAATYILRDYLEQQRS